jgi:predicted aldo/keto reductase-like oxidoreductase
MQYRTFPTIPELPVSALGMGMMRLPVVGNNQEKIDTEAAEAVFCAAIEEGVNYIDTAYPYHGGTSEPFTGTIIKKHKLREKISLATKCPVWLVQNESDWDRLLSEQLQRLQTDFIDFYLFHGLNDERWNTILTLKGIEFAEKAKQEGKIRHIGFSFHAPLPIFKKILDGYDRWEFCQVQFNYFDTDYQAGLEGIQYAGKKGVGVIVMEPLRGGTLSTLPEPAIQLFEKTGYRRTPADWALRYVLNRPEVVLALSGMNAVSQVRENARVARETRVNSLTEEEYTAYREVAEYFRKKTPIPCTACSYCMPCPNGVAIPDVFSLYNGAVAFNIKEQNRERYRKFYQSAQKGGDACIACGTCLSKCPQSIDIINSLAEADAYFA